MGILGTSIHKNQDQWLSVNLGTSVLRTVFLLSIERILRAASDDFARLARQLCLLILAKKTGMEYLKKPSNSLFHNGLDLSFVTFDCELQHPPVAFIRYVMSWS
jgi:hypothetical protein